MEEYDDFESWEGHYELHELEDYPALVELCEREVAARPEDLHAYERLAEAYLLNGQPEKVIDAIGPVHVEHPEIYAFAHYLLDALFAMGKNEHDYPWEECPKVLRIGSEVADACFDYLRPKRKARSISELCLKLEGPTYLAFTEEDLLAFLRSDGRFVIEDGLVAWSSLVKVDRKKAKRRR